ncbi:hypothetical protein [Paracoccus saliphilus]|uniref:Uncharacterized protein n=1 Tax=Paracoccus saliphilus TaxID=405559 RepID=A0ABY7S4H6_9RHOB|nr:hypothetical protein [Paracoccus saliphilus]WCR01970.1 hypothetical protein JHX88_13730 [Paracoccus saliphilus]
MARFAPHPSPHEMMTLNSRGELQPWTNSIMTHRSTAFDFFAYTAAFVIGLGTVWLFTAQFVGQIFTPGSLRSPDTGTILIMLTPLGGLAIFQLVFGLTTRRWRAFRFWLYAPLIVYLIIGLIGLAVFSGTVSVIEAAVLAAVLIFAVGLYLLTLPKRS